MNIKRYIVYILTFACLKLAYAEDLTLSDGKVYSNVKVNRIEPDGITISHVSGITKVYFWELSADIQQKYSYDPAKAREYNIQAQSRQAALAAKQQEAAARNRKQTEYEEANIELLTIIRQGATELVGTVQQITEDGVLISNAKVPYRSQDDVVPAGYTRITYNGQYSSKTKYVHAAADYEPVFVIGAGSGYTDGAKWSAIVYPAGTYSYTTVMGAGKTVKCFALTAQQALDNMVNNQK